MSCKNTSGEIREQIASLSDEAQALIDIAKESDAGEMSADQRDRFNAIMDTEIPDLEKKLEERVKLEERQKKLAALRENAVRPQNGSPIAVASAEPRVRLVSKKLNAFKGEDALRNAYDSGMWFLAALSRGQNEKAVRHCESRGIQLAQTEGTNSEGGFTVPDPLSDAIIDVREQVGISRKVCRVVPMSSDTLNIPKRSSGLSVKYPGEATAITASDKVWAQVSLTAVKRATLTKVSQELIADSVINVIDDLASEIGHALALQEDNELINGDGTGTYGSETGLIVGLTGTGTAGIVDADSGEDTWEELDLDEFHNLVSTLPEEYHPGASWIMSRSFFHLVVERLAVAAGISTLQPAGLVAEGQSRTQFLGYPINFTDQMPAEAASTMCALFGNFAKSVIIGDRGDMAIESSAHYAFDEDVITVRGTTRYDINVHETGDGSNAGGYVGLRTAA